MNFACILASGSGKRFGSQIPKQFLEIAGKPVIVRTLEAFKNSGKVDAVFAVVSEDYKNYTENIVKNFSLDDVNVVVGGENRNKSLLNGLKFTVENFDVCEDDIILTHDAVRPFVDGRIITENIEKAKKFGACGTVIKSVDTVIMSDDGEFMTGKTDRKKMFSCQTPQTFKLKELYETYLSLSDEECSYYTDACTVYFDRGKKIALCEGSENLFKITYPEDLKKAELILNGGK